MLNKESRSYFNRAFLASGSAINTYALTSANHTRHVQNCSKADEMENLIGYLKAENCATLISWPWMDGPNDEWMLWVPSIERSDTKGAFLTKTPEEIYDDFPDEAPIMDTLFSFTAQVHFQMVIFPGLQEKFHSFCVFGLLGNATKLQ